MKKLSQLITSIKPIQVVGNTDIEITDVINDSRKAREGVLFVAVKGVAVDSHRFIADVIAVGARAIVCEELPDKLHDYVTYIQVDNSVVALAHIADEWFDHPSRNLRLVGVTGTNGKTTTATLLYEMARLMGHKAGLLSTVKNIIDTREENAKQTTPDHLTLNRLLHEMVKAGCEYAFMEVSSHACVQRRIEGITFAGGIFTNLTRDHMDFHKTVDNYIAAKKMFFDMLPDGAFALVNADDKVGEVMLQNTRARKFRYSLRAMADYKGRIVESRLDGIKYAAITAAAGAGLLFASGAVICEGVLGRTYLNHGPEEPLNDPGNLRRYLTNEKYKTADDWFVANCTGDTILITKDNDRIHANVIKADIPTHKWAVLVHGFSSRPRTMAKQGYHYAQMGYNTLFPFMRGHRNDEHRHTTFGYYERYDVIEWINYIISCDPEAEILIHGCSMGAATTMLVTGEDLPANVKCVVADCGFTTAWDEFKEQIGNILHLPAFPFLNAANLFSNLFLKWDFKACSPLAAVGRSRTPTLFIHGENDKFVPYRMMAVLYDNCAAEKDKLSVPGAAHDESCEKAPELYWEKTDAFVGKYIK